MIRKDIVVHKPVVALFPQQQRPPTYSVVTRSPPINIERAAFSGRWAYKGILQNQEVYERYLADAPFRPGNFVKLLGQPADALHRVHYVIDVIKTCQQVPFQFERGHPKPFRLMQMCFPGDRSPWIRYETCLDHEIISDDEYDRLISPEYDKLQDSIKEYVGASPF